MELVIIGLVTAANFLILKVKVEQNRWADLIFDISVLSILSFLFSGANFTLFFHPFHSKPSTFLSLKQACKIVA